MSKIILISGASSGFGALAARALAERGHTVYTGMRETVGRNAPQVQAAEDFARDHNVALIPVELDVASQTSVDAAVAKVIGEQNRIDVLVHNAGHMVLGPTEAFSVEQLAAQYDINVLSTQRLNKAVLPHMRARRGGLLVWNSSSSARGGTPPWLGPYFAAKAGMDSLAVTYAGELARWGIETSIIVPGAFTTGTNHFLHSGRPADKDVEAEYLNGPYANFEQEMNDGFALIEPEGMDVGEVAKAIAEVVDLPFGKRPFRVHIDPMEDGCEIVNTMADRVRAEFLRRTGLGDLLKPHAVLRDGQTETSKG